MSVADRIESLLSKIESDHSIQILYACESGSRAWGFASPDSDYDIRFIYRNPDDAYRAIMPERATIELAMVEDLDAGGWDIRKAAQLMGKSNGALLEWLHSPIIYRNSPGFLDRWRTAAVEVFSPRAAMDHYRGLARQMWLGKLQAETVRAKDYLYALRACLASNWIGMGKGLPPVPFQIVLEVAPDGIRSVVPDLLAHKAATMESSRMPRIPLLDAFLEQTLSPDVELPPAVPPGISVLNRLFASELDEPRASTRPMRKSAFSLARIRRNNLLLFESVVGSHAYGTATADSDEDLRGVFVAPASFLGSLDSIDQVNDERNDQVYFELGRLMTLLARNNPNVLELLAVPEDCVRYRHPLYDLLDPEIFLSKLCLNTFGEYAMGQIRKARGLNKKIVNPQPETRRALLDFCHVPIGQGSVPVLIWLREQGISLEDCGLTALAHAADLFAIYHEPGGSYRGLISPKDPDALRFSSVPIEAKPVAWMHFNQDAFRAHCKAHREYWEWVGNRNEARFLTNQDHGRGYDSKNLLHTHRLLDMAGEIAREGILKVRRPNREFLLRVKAGDFSYEELVDSAERKIGEVRADFARSSLPEEPDRERINDLLVELRQRFASATQWLV